RSATPTTRCSSTCATIRGVGWSSRVPSPTGWPGWPGWTPRGCGAGCWPAASRRRERCRGRRRRRCGWRPTGCGERWDGIARALAPRRVRGVLTRPLALPLLPRRAGPHQRGRRADPGGARATGPRHPVAGVRGVVDALDARGVDLLLIAVTAELAAVVQARRAAPGVRGDVVG